MNEKWKPVIGWPGYDVSSIGRVRSVPRILGDGRPAGGVMLRQRRDGKGYALVDLRSGSRKRTVRVHVLVAEAFIGPRPAGMQILHRKDDHSRNDVRSLRYGSGAENMQERVERQKKYRGQASAAVAGSESRAESRP